MKIYNSLTQRKAALETLVPGTIGMYVCGMTVYDFCHLGHARVLVAFDVITRYLRHKGYDLTYVRNITDVDDKIIQRALINGESVDKLTERFILAMHEDEQSLGVRRPDIEPRATQHIGHIIEMILTLEGKGVAYQGGNGDVYFSIERFPDYGKLSKRKPEELLAGARVEVQDSKRNPLDFVLWKQAKEGEVCWDSPWGKGRPGWHIECSAMSADCLGVTFDIHGGGPDLLFPHHENEIAQSEAAHGCEFVRQWMHAGAVRVDKEKMSKSLGNFFTIREVLKKHPAEVLRYFIVASHYRSPIDYSEDSLKEATASLTRLYNSFRDLYDDMELTAPDSLTSDAICKYPVGKNDTAPEGPLLTEEHRMFRLRFEEAMDDDFNTPAALAVLFDMAKTVNTTKKTDRSLAIALACEMVSLSRPLGLLQMSPDLLLQGDRNAGGVSAEEVEHLIVARQDARTAKDWAESDRIRDFLLSKGVLLNDSREGTTWTRQDS
jgi:cysteinyl-tRNA synthetase